MPEASLLCKTDLGGGWHQVSLGQRLERAAEPPRQPYAVGGLDTADGVSALVEQWYSGDGCLGGKMNFVKNRKEGKEK